MAVNGARVHIRRVHFTALAAIGFTAATCMLTGLPIKPEYGVAVAALLLPLAGSEIWKPILRYPFCGVLAAFIVFAAFQILYLHAGGHGSLQHFSAAASKPVKLGVAGAVIGAWLSIYPLMAWVALALMLAGLLYQTVGALAIAGVTQFLSGHARLVIGYPTNLGAMWLGVAAVGTVLGLLHMYRSPRGVRRTAALAIGAACAAFLLFALLLTGSRGPWLATAAALLVTTPTYFCRVAGDGRWRPRTVVKPALASLLVLVPIAALAVYRIAVAGRLTGAGEITDAILTHDAAEIPMSSVGMRLHLLALGFDSFVRHPWAGIGLASIEALIERSSIHFSTFVPTHLHNIYLQALTGFGAVGFALLLLGGVILGRAFATARPADARGRLLQVILAGAAIVVLLENLTDCLVWRLIHARIPLEVLLGCGIAVALQARRARGDPDVGVGRVVARQRDGIADATG